MQKKTGNAIRALGRMATLSASRRNSASSTNNNITARPLTDCFTSKMSSLNEEEAKGAEMISQKLNGINEEKTDLKLTNRVDENGRRLIRNRACSERSDSGISDCSSHLTANSVASTPLLNTKYLINEVVEESKQVNEDCVAKCNKINDSLSDSKSTVPKVKLNEKIETFIKKIPAKSE